MRDQGRLFREGDPHTESYRNSGISKAGKRRAGSMSSRGHTMSNGTKAESAESLPRTI